jgi:hypothetical protein
MIINTRALVIIILLGSKLQIMTPTLSPQAIVLTAAGFLGGIFSSVAGSGVDICSFSILSLLFRSAGRSSNNLVFLFSPSCSVAL